MHEDAGSPRLLEGEPDRKLRWPFFVVLAVMIAVSAFVLWKTTRGTCSDCQPVVPAQADLRDAMAAAKTYYTRHESYRGFDPHAARKIEPALAWNESAKAVSNEVSIRGVTGRTVLLVTADGQGNPWCIADDADSVTTYGRVDAQTDADCANASW